MRKKRTILLTEDIEKLRRNIGYTDAIEIVEYAKPQLKKEAERLAKENGKPIRIIPGIKGVA